MEAGGTSVAHSLYKSVHENNMESLTSLSDLKNYNNQSQAERRKSTMLSHNFSAHQPFPEGHNHLWLFSEGREKDFSKTSCFTPCEEDAVPAHAQTKDTSNSLRVAQGYDMV